LHGAASEEGTAVVVAPAEVVVLARLVVVVTAGVGSAWDSVPVRMGPALEEVEGHGGTYKTIAGC
jgi:hypothetical protein